MKNQYHINETHDGSGIRLIIHFDKHAIRLSIIQND